MYMHTHRHTHMCTQAHTRKVHTVSIENFVNFVVFADATIPQNLILDQRQFTQLQMAGTHIDYNAERSQ